MFNLTFQSSAYPGTTIIQTAKDIGWWLPVALRAMCSAMHALDATEAKRHTAHKNYAMQNRTTSLREDDVSGQVTQFRHHGCYAAIQGGARAEPARKSSIGSSAFPRLFHDADGVARAGADDGVA